MGLSQISCADWPLARVVNSGAWVGPDESAWGKEFGTGVWGGLSGFTEATLHCGAFASPQVSLSRLEC